MKKIIMAAGAISAALALMFTVGACSGGDTYTVSFESNGGSAVESQQVEAAAMPPSRKTPPATDIFSPTGIPMKNFRKTACITLQKLPSMPIPPCMRAG